MLNFTEELHIRPYMVTKRRRVWNKYIREMTTKASNVI